MDHLDRTPLLLEFALPSKQRLKPGGQRKDRTRRHRSRTSASMPHAGGEENIIRRISDKQRLNQARDINKGLTRRRAKRDHADRRKPADQGHLSDKRSNPSAEIRPEKRGNPQAKAETQVRTSPSKQQRRPTLPASPKFFDRGSMRL